MAKPQVLQRLKPGKFVWPGLFPFFAATWNWLLGAFDGLRGDYDLSRKEGLITVDWRDPDNPVIRLRKDRLMEFLKDALKESPGCFEPTFDETEEEYTVANPYYRVGGKTYEAGVDGGSIEDGKIMALSIDATGAQPSAELVALDGIAALNNLEADLNYCVVPLYIVSGGKITCDFRKGAIAVMSEF